MTQKFEFTYGPPVSREEAHRRLASHPLAVVINGLPFQEFGDFSADPPTSSLVIPTTDWQAVAEALPTYLQQIISERLTAEVTADSVTWIQVRPSRIVGYSDSEGTSYRAKHDDGRAITGEDDGAIQVVCLDLVPVPPALADQEPAANEAAPPTVVLCGAARFEAEFGQATRRLTLGGAIVLSPGVFTDGPTVTPDELDGLDALQRAKIDRADSVLVINPDGHIDGRTRAHIAHAHHRSLRVNYTEPDGIPGAGWRLIAPTAPGPWICDGYGQVARADCPACHGSGLDAGPGGRTCALCVQKMSAVLPRTLAERVLHSDPGDYGIAAHILLDHWEGGDPYAAIAGTTDRRRGLAAINAAARDELGHRLAGGDFPHRVTAARVSGLLVTVDLDHAALIGEPADVDQFPFDARPVSLSDPDAVPGVWAVLEPDVARWSMFVATSDADR